VIAPYCSGGWYAVFWYPPSETVYVLPITNHLCRVLDLAVKQRSNQLDRLEITESRSKCYLGCQTCIASSGPADQGFVSRLNETATATHAVIHHRGTHSA